MLLIPFGAEEDGSRPKPVVTIALIVVNVAWFVWMNLGFGATWKADVERARKDVEEYWSEHPSLTPPESLARLLGPEEMAEELGRVKAAAATRKREMAWLDDLSRQELDRRVKRLEEALARRPLTRFGFVPAHPEALGAAASLFTHAGVVHLAGNMIFLWATGPFVEAILGPFLFLLLYLVGGLAATATHWLAASASTTPLVGASGAIAAVMGALLVRNAAAKIRFLFLPILWVPRIRFIFGIPALVVLPLWFAEQVGSAHVDPDAPVAWWAHIGGFAFGMAAGGLLYLATRKRVPARTTAPARPRATRTITGEHAVLPRSIPRSAPEQSSRTTRPGGSVDLVRASRGSASLRVTVVSPGAPGEVVIAKDAERIFHRPLARVPPGGFAVDEHINIREGPVELRIELRLAGAPLRATSVMVVLKKSESRDLRIELKDSGLTAEIR